MASEYDAIVIGTGAGGGTLAYRLAMAGMRVLILERGSFLPREKENWSPRDVFLKERYHTSEHWHDKEGKPFRPGTHYFVGGNTKVYGAALLRLRKEDFGKINHHGGVSPAWPIGYEAFQPFYREAEALYQVHGKRGEDPTEPPEDEPYTRPPLSHEPRIKEIFDRLKAIGHKPFHLPVGVHRDEENPEKSPCIRCDTCDGFPCLVNAKSDAHIMCINEAIKRPNVTLITHAKVLKLHSKDKRVTEVEAEVEGEVKRFKGDIVCVSCGAINSAALLIRSGLANSSGMVGRHYMSHNNSAIVAISKTPNPTKFPKTLGLNDFYFGSDDWDYPLGHIQLLGAVKKDMLEGDAPKITPGKALEVVADHAVGWWITSEDLPHPENRVTLDKAGGIVLDYTPNNEEGHKRLLEKLKGILKEVGCEEGLIPSSVYLAKKIPLAGVAHQVGTCRFGEDPKQSVLDPNCKAHDLENLYVVDGSFFCSSSAVNPGLTIIANALRVGHHLASL